MYGPPAPSPQSNSDTRIMKYILFFVVLIAAVALAFSGFEFITKELSRIINAFTPKFGKWCFDADTKIVMQDGSHRKIIDIEIGDVLFNDSKVLGTMKFSGKDVTLFNNDGILSTPEHHVLHDGIFKRVSEIPNIQPSDKQVNYLYDLDTTDHRIVCLNDKKEHVVYTDFSEIDDKDDFIEKYELSVLNNKLV